MNKAKIGVIGAGDIGFNIAELLAIDGYDVVVYNRHHGSIDKPDSRWLHKVGKLMDLTDAMQIDGRGDISLTHNINDLTGISYLIITSGAKRSRLDETRDDLALKNATILMEFTDFIAMYPDMLVMIVTNPVDFLTNFLVHMVSTINSEDVAVAASRIVGVSYVDTMRLRNLVKQYVYDKHQIIPKKIDCITLGEHGLHMVPIMSHITIDGKPISDFVSSDGIEDIRKKTISRGNDIIELTSASSVKCPAHAVSHMVKTIDNNSTTILPCSVFHEGVAIGHKVRFTDRKVNVISSVSADKEECESFTSAMQYLKRQYSTIMKKFSDN